VSDIHGPQYHPRSVTVERRDGVWCIVDRSYAGAEHVGRSTGSTERDRLQCEAVAKVRRATIKGALTRRANKARRAREDAATALDVRRAAACKEAGVTWSWLTEDLTPAEADAWLGLD